MSTVIHWFRRDLRLTDNLALCADYEEIVPVYIVSTWTRAHSWCGAARQEFLCGSLASLAKNLEAKGGRLIIRQGPADRILEELVRETGADAISFNCDPDPYGRAMERRIQAMAKRLGTILHAHQDVTMHAPDAVLTAAGTPFRVFTPYAQAWRKLKHAAPVRVLPRLFTRGNIPSDPLPTLQTWGLSGHTPVPEPGEAAARKRLTRFLDDPILHYAERRNLPERDGTSRLSQDLRFGTLGIREVFARSLAVLEKAPAFQRRSVEMFLNELIWREFFMQVLWHRLDVLEQEWQEKYRALKWRSHWRPDERPAKGHFQSWCHGQTGFPIVDAGMRELAATGFMHNRVRMITAMFLVKDLHVWWMHGESWFMQRLIDGEIASNNGGWQWSASTGTDAAPYFRIQNPWSQTKRFDPEGGYIRRWVPELRDVPARLFYQVPDEGCSLARGYPAPIVDHSQEREVAMEMFRK